MLIGNIVNCEILLSLHVIDRKFVFPKEAKRFCSHCMYLIENLFFRRKHCSRVRFLNCEINFLRMVNVKKPFCRMQKNFFYEYEISKLN